jgi:hypothetical protein
MTRTGSAGSRKLKGTRAQNSEFLASLLNLSVAFLNTGRADEADMLVNHPLVQFRLDRECGPGVMGNVSAEDEAFLNEINQLLSRRDRILLSSLTTAAAVVKLESKILSLVSTLRKLRQDHTAGALLNNLVVCLDRTGNARGAQELAQKIGKKNPATQDWENVRRNTRSSRSFWSCVRRGSGCRPRILDMRLLCVSTRSIPRWPSRSTSSIMWLALDQPCARDICAFDHVTHI